MTTTEGTKTALVTNDQLLEESGSLAMVMTEVDGLRSAVIAARTSMNMRLSEGWTYHRIETFLEDFPKTLQDHLERLNGAVRDYFAICRIHRKSMEQSTGADHE